MFKVNFLSLSLFHNNNFQQILFYYGNCFFIIWSLSIFSLQLFWLKKTYLFKVGISTSFESKYIDIA